MVKVLLHIYIKNRLFIQWDHEGDSYVYALDTKTGEVAWSDERDEMTSWATPYVLEVNGKTQVITSATNNIRSYDFDTGEIILDLYRFNRQCNSKSKIC